MNDVIVGTCSICGGPVVIPNMIMSVGPVVARCKLCWATQAEDYGPVIQMTPRRLGGGKSSC